MLKNPAFKKVTQNDWVVAFFLLVIFLLTNGYIFGWDDQHLELPLLKKLIDPALYPNDYYVDSLVKNFPSYFYLILSKIISIEQIQITYLILFLICRYALFLGIYKIWKFLSGRRDVGFLITTVIICLARIPELLYRTFSHQEFALSIVIFGLYYFYRERFILSAVLLGIAANFHLIYSLFPMSYVGLYLLLNVRRYKFKTLFLSCVTYLACTLPVLIWIFQKIHLRHLPVGSTTDMDWYNLYKYINWPNFLFKTTSLGEMGMDINIFLFGAEPYLLAGAMYAINYIFLPQFKKDGKIHSIGVASLLMLLVSFIFTYIHPSRFVIDLNLIRNLQYLEFFLIGYTLILLVRETEEKPLYLAALSAITLGLIRFMDLTAVCSMTFLGSLLVFNHGRRQTAIKTKTIYLTCAGVLLALTVLGLNYTFRPTFYGNYGSNAKIVLLVSIALIGITLLVGYVSPTPGVKKIIRKLFLIIPVILVFASYCNYHYQFHVQWTRGDGLWQLQRNWLDMQRYVKAHTEKDDLFLVPHDTEAGGFRIFSERSVVASFRDCGIAGFDYNAFVEWNRRITDIWSFKVFLDQKSSATMDSALIRAVLKYHVNYVVFMRYAEPEDKISFLTKVYTNEVFSLYRVRAAAAFSQE